MNSGRKTKRIKKSDFGRVVSTETIPYETPVIFSNKGFHKHMGFKEKDPISDFLFKSLVLGEIGEAPNSTIPFGYKVRKDSSEEFRRLAILHPLSQWKVRKFYENYDKLILYFCSQSPASIRAPDKIASTFYIKSAWENIYQYKTGSILESKDDSFTKHTPSYFAYRGYDRLYKFFDSRDYFDLEIAFSVLKTLDVSKCFDSIYTHCLSWAIKDKEFTKKYLDVKSTFAQEFDALMCHLNHNETNGIVIGPEISRIFAELIFQSIDCRCINKLQQAPFELSFGKQYTFRRYVDDVFIFAQDEKTAKTVYECYSDVLISFNLHPNTLKSKLYTRPFVTLKSRITREASVLINTFLDRFLEQGISEEVLEPKKIHYPWRLTRSFVNSVKSLCSYNNVTYDEISTYLIAVLVERVKKLVNVSKDVITKKQNEIIYRDACIVLIDALYFLYSVSPSVSASYKLCTAIIVLIRFSERLGQYGECLKQRLYELTAQLLESDTIGKGAAVDSFIPLELVNVVLTIRELENRYLLPLEVIEKLFMGRNTFTYFDIVSCLFFVRNENQYIKIKRRLISASKKKLKTFSDILMNTEKACLLLDLLACPYVDNALKKEWITRLYQRFDQPLPSVDKITNFLQSVQEHYWFVDWKDVDLLNSLEKKELKQAY